MAYNNMDKGGGGGGGGPLDGQIDWGGNGGKIYECWVVQPCCDGYCCATWFCCGCFNACKVCDRRSDIATQLFCRCSRGRSTSRVRL